MTLLLDEEKIMVMEIKKPDLVGSGFGTAINGTLTPPIIADPLIIEKENAMVDLNKKTPAHIRIPRSLNEDPLWKKLSLQQQSIFLTIVFEACYRPQSFDDFGVLIDLQPGQLCISIRDLTDLCHHQINKNFVERALSKLQTCRFLRQEVRHRKSIITITHSDTYELIKMSCETNFETNLRQTRDKLETQTKKDKKEKKVKNINKPIASAIATSLLDYFILSLKKNIPEVVKMPETSEAIWFDKLLTAYSPEEIKSIIDFSHGDSFWRGHVLSPKKLVVGPPANPDRFAVLLAAKKRPISGVKDRSFLGGKKQVEYDNAY